MPGGPLGESRHANGSRASQQEDGGKVQPMGEPPCLDTLYVVSTLAHKWDTTSGACGVCVCVVALSRVEGIWANGQLGNWAWRAPPAILCVSTHIAECVCAHGMYMFFFLRVCICTIKHSLHLHAEWQCNLLQAGSPFSSCFLPFPFPLNRFLSSLFPVPAWTSVLQARGYQH